LKRKKSWLKELGVSVASCFESEDDIEDDKCMACGCPKNVHLKVKIVTVNGGVI
jgi:hypothetical protein